MEIYSTLSRKKEEFQPLTEGQIKMYVCGPTVYNLIHIGNARSSVVPDTIRRYMLYKGYDVNYVQNFTDVDDRIIANAIKEGISAKEYADRYIEEFFTDMKGLNVMPATVHPRVSEEMPEIVEMIQTLIDRNHAYERNGSVYFAVERDPDYGKLSHRNIDDMMAGARIEIDDEKENPMDFVLWKPAKEGEPSWESPWGAGRPGWHIECSVMAKKYLGETIDIHGGGEDLVFPHHENEIAQSECACGKPFAKYWLHMAMLNVDNTKMSKSLGNFFTLREVAEKYGYNIVRFFLLTAHYRSPINFSDELIRAADNALERIKNCARSLSECNTDGGIDSKFVEGTAQFTSQFEAAMDDDFNTANGITAIFELVKYINRGLTAETSKATAEALYAKLQTLTDIMGVLLVEPEGAGNDEDAEIEALIEQRQQARKDKDFKTADTIRDELVARGIVIKDTPEGVKWHRK